MGQKQPTTTVSIFPGLYCYLLTVAGLLMAALFLYIFIHGLVLIPVFLWMLWKGAQHDESQHYSEAELTTEKSARVALAILVPLLTVSTVSVLIMLKRMCCQPGTEKADKEKMIKTIT